MGLKLNRTAADSLRIYSEGLLDAVRTARAAGHKAPSDDDLILALTDTDDFPELESDPNVGFMCGWLTGASEVLGVLPETLMAEVTLPERAPQKAKAAKRRARGKIADDTEPQKLAAEHGARARNGVKGRKCPKCGGALHRCKTGDAGCMHCDTDGCDYMREPARAVRP